MFEEITTENFPDLIKETNIQVQESQRVPNKMNTNRPTPRHNINKMEKVKENSKGNKRKSKSQIEGNTQKAVS